MFRQMKSFSVLFITPLLLAVSPLFAFQEADLDRMIPVLDQVRDQEIQSWRERIVWEKRHASRQHELNSRFAQIDLEIFFEGDSIGATVQTQFLSLVNGLSEVKLEFEEAFTVDSVFGNGVAFTLLGETLTVTLDQPYDSNETFSIATAYHGVPPLVGGLKGFRFESHQGIPIAATLCTPFLAHLWWPCVDGPADKLDSVHISITIPDTSFGGYPLYAASNGKLVGITSPTPGYVTFEWHENYPIVPYYVSVAVSNYRIFSHYYHYGADSMEVPYYVFPEDYQSAESTFAETVDMIDYFAGLFGEYPFVLEKYSMAEIGFYGAIEKQTKTIMGGVHPGWYLVVCHELAHMWFGDMISPASWHHCWVNEGFATYCEALWVGDRFGNAQYHQYMNSIEYLEGGTIYLYDISDPFQIFMAICYYKGAWVLHMLRHVVGDSTFFNIMYTYSTDPRFMYGNASTEDFQQVCEDISGLDLSEFFAQWIYDEYYPRYEYGWNYTELREGRYQIQVTIRQTQGALGWRPVFVMPIDLYIGMPGGDTTIVVQNNDTLQTYQFELDEIPGIIYFDLYDWILKYVQVGVGEEDDREAAIGNVRLEVSPNPVLGSCVVEYSVPKAGHVTVDLYDVTGRWMKNLHRGEKDAGTYRIRLNAKEMPAGIYFVRMNDSSRRKLVILR